MKKILALALALIMVLALAACGGNEENPSGSGTTDPGTSQQEQSGGTDIDNINTSNWSEVIENNYGLKLSLPSGWTVSDTYGKSISGIVEVEFNIGADEKTKMFEEFEAYGEEIFAALKEIAVGDITHAHDTSTVYNSFAEADGGFHQGDMRVFVDAEKNKSIIIHYTKVDGKVVTLELNKDGF